MILSQVIKIGQSDSSQTMPLTKLKTKAGAALISRKGPVTGLRKAGTLTSTNPFRKASHLKGADDGFVLEKKNISRLVKTHT